LLRLEEARGGAGSKVFPEPKPLVAGWEIVELGELLEA
jgi:hypothetical protein